MSFYYNHISGQKNVSQEAIKEKAVVQFLGPPTNCSDLGKLGYTLNGYYLVKGSSKMSIVYCMFLQAQGLAMMSKQGNKVNPKFTLEQRL